MMIAFQALQSETIHRFGHMSESKLTTEEVVPLRAKESV